jgi:alpha-ketoglutarate-dependent taurine dioxygenase
MPSIDMLHASSLDEALELVDKVAERLKTDVVVGIRGVNLSDEEQIIFTRALGDVIGWYPNTGSSFKQKYQENHGENFLKSQTTGDELCLHWHLEWVGYKTPIIGATWNMIKFKCDPETGKTYFVDSSRIYREMPEEMQLFASRCVSAWVEKSGPKSIKYTPVVQEHPITKDSVLRIDIADTFSTPDLLHTVDGREPTEEERIKYMALRDYYVDQTYNNEEIRVVHRWQQGDLLIPNMFKALHAVTGGFDSEDREFIGYWAYPEEPKEDN